MCSMIDVTPTTIPDVKIVTPRVFGDARGFFVESFRREEYARALGVSEDAFVQDNLSCSARGVLRGLHFQRAPYAQGKLVSVLRGAVFDVAVDMRPTSPTYGSSVHITLTPPTFDANTQMWTWKQFWIPPGFAHGFLALDDDTLFSYKCTHAVYTPSHDAGIRWNDPTLAIPWPMERYGIARPIVSEKDSQLPVFTKCDDGESV